MVDYVSDVTLLLQNFRAFAYSGQAPAEIKEQLQRIPGTDADVICAAAELLYAYYDELTDEGKRSMGELFNYAVNHNWAGFNKEGRSAEIVRLVSIDIGDAEGDMLPDEEWPEPSTDRRTGNDWRSSPTETPTIEAPE